jgi:hypothetical protein
MSLLKSFNCKKRGTGYAKVIHKKEKEVLKKMDKCPGYLKQWVLGCLPEKRRKMNKIAHVFLQKFSKFQSREICFKEHSRIRLAVGGRYR